jgi:hypothetical protein
MIREAALRMRLEDLGYTHEEVEEIVSNLADDAVEDERNYDEDE